MIIRTQENYRKVLKTIVRLKKEYWIFLLTLFNILVGPTWSARSGRYPTLFLTKVVTSEA